MTIEEELQCGICREIFYIPSTVMPCLHSFCGPCISQVIKTRVECPLCNTRMSQIARNRTLSSILLSSNLSDKRTDEEKTQLESLNLIGQQPFIVTDLEETCESADDYSGESYSEEEGLESRFCPQCDGLCNPEIEHSLCHFDLTPFHTLSGQESILQKCTDCGLDSCSITEHADDFALLQDLYFHDSSATKMNEYENRKYFVYLRSFSTNENDVFFNDLKSRGLEYLLTLPFCRDCASERFCESILAHRKALSKEEMHQVLGVDIPDDCYWGENCRTQYHNEDHAMKYNHICPQRRFQ